MRYCACPDARALRKRGSLALLHESLLHVDLRCAHATALHREAGRGKERGKGTWRPPSAKYYPPYSNHVSLRQRNHSMGIPSVGWLLACVLIVDYGGYAIALISMH